MKFTTKRCEAPEISCGLAGGLGGAVCEHVQGVLGATRMPSGAEVDSVAGVDAGVSIGRVIAEVDEHRGVAPRDALSERAHPLDQSVPRRFVLVWHEVALAHIERSHHDHVGAGRSQAGDDFVHFALDGRRVVVLAHEVVASAQHSGEVRTKCQRAVQLGGSDFGGQQVALAEVQVLVELLGDPVCPAEVAVPGVASRTPSAILSPTATKRV